jgi:dTDP-glucose 4,6-dehydratase
MKNILVTGGAGFIGSHFINNLIAKEEDVRIINFDKLTYAANLDNLIINDRLINIKGDITQERDLEDVFSGRKIDTLVNFAAETHVDNSIMNPHIFTEVNTLGFQKLLYKAMSHDVDNFIHISTDEVYGSNNLDCPFVESDALNAANPYSASKAGAELIMKAVENTFGYKGIIIRPSNNYGTHQYPEKLIPLSIKLLTEGKKIGLYGDGQQQRDWLEVDDHVEIIRQLLHRGEKGQIYNICSGIERTNADVIRLLIDSVNRISGSGYSFETHVDFIDDRKGHDFRYTMSSQKVQDTLGVYSFKHFEEQMDHVVRAFLIRYGVIV